MASVRSDRVTVTFAGCGDAFGSGGRFQACIHVRHGERAPVLLDCGATSLPALRRCGLDPGAVGAVFVSHLHGDHFGGLVAGVKTEVFQASHPSGAPALILRLDLGGTVIAYTGDTAWTAAIAAAADDADLLIAEAYYWEKKVPHHLSHADLADHERDLVARRIVLTHMSADMIARAGQARHETAHDGLVVTL
jgi:ribonuclease BN (tRNA processing enzyme)